MWAVAALPALIVGSVLLVVMGTVWAIAAGNRRPKKNLP